MSYDLLIKNGTVIDGSGLPRYRADVGVNGGKITTIGRIRNENAREIIDASTLWGFHDRGLIREGMAADMVVFDPDTIMAEMPEVVDDLPAGARRLVQRTRGVAATVVNGEALLRNGRHTGALPGQLLRGPLGKRG